LGNAAAASLDGATQTIKASAKAAGVVIDDAAVTPRYVVGFAAERELPIIGRIARGSLTEQDTVLATGGIGSFSPRPVGNHAPIDDWGVFLCFEGASSGLGADDLFTAD
jgi:predicted DNA repair protein MutK